MSVRWVLVAVLVFGTTCSVGPTGKLAPSASPSPAQSNVSPARESASTASPSPAQSNVSPARESVSTASPSPAQTRAAQAFGVVFGSGPGGIAITVVGADGRIYGHASPRYRSGNEESQPMVSTSDSAVYYLDGDAALMRLRPGGTPEHLRDLPGTTSTRASFAVSPDDKRIAIALITYGPAPTGPGVGGPNYLGMKLYVEDLDGTNHVDLFSSPTVAEWPVGWHGSDLVIAVSDPQIPGLGVDPYPYFAFAGIHVASATTGERKASLCSGWPVLGLATPSALLCAAPSGTVESDWAGRITPTGLQCKSAQLQPGGADIACASFGAAPFVWSAGTQQPLPVSPIDQGRYDIMCWVGHDHLLLGGPYGTALFDVRNGSTQLIHTLAQWTVGAIPGGL